MISKKEFTAIVLSKVEKKATYIDAIASTARELGIEEAAVPSVLEKIVKENLEAEARELRLLK